MAKELKIQGKKVQDRSRARVDGKRREAGLGGHVARKRK